MPEAQMVIVTGCDENYFPLAKGLILSLTERGNLGKNIKLAFLDIGCSEKSRYWLVERGVTIVDDLTTAMGGAGSATLGYHRAQTCRAFLPELFPAANVLCWVDCDIWFQDLSILDILRRDSDRYPEALHACPEIHFTYTKINECVDETHLEHFGNFSGIYGDVLANNLHKLPCVNSGFIVMNRMSKLWDAWKTQIVDIYVKNFANFDKRLLHFAEQTSLNMLIRSGFPVRYFDPLYNYLCLWNPPFRDEVGVVRVSAPPYHVVGAAHLAGGWRHFGRIYSERELLYRSGDYLTDDEKVALLKAFGAAAFQ